MKEENKRKNAVSADGLRCYDIRPGIPIIEICGCRRVLVENHCGIAAYGREEIMINVMKGKIRICGENMYLSRMNRGKLVIFGTIKSVDLLRCGKDGIV